MITYSLQLFIDNERMQYKLTPSMGYIFQLIQEIDNDDLSFIELYQHDIFDNIVNKYSQYIENYCKLNCKTLTQDIHQIAYAITLFSLVLFYEQHIEKYTYTELKDKLQIIKNIDIHNLIQDTQVENWFRVSTPIKKDYLLSKEAHLEIQKRQDISFITYTNLGYLKYTKNLILSLEKCDFPLPLTIYCVDQGAYDNLQNMNSNIILKLLNDETNSNEEFIEYYKEGWNTMMLSKIKAIRKELIDYDYVFYTDSDIVFENNYCIQYLLDNLHDYDLLVQNNCNEQFCAGFMFLKSNDKTIQLFDTKDIDMDKFKCDQSYLNSKKDCINYRVLSPELFPVGCFYYDNYETIAPWIIHFNWIIGNKKIDKMYFHKKWYAIPSFHLLIATMGRKTLIQMLDSIVPQMEESDFITVVYDNKDTGNTFETVKNMKTRCKLNVIMNNETYDVNYPQHSIRNKYNDLEGDFIFHGDDDDIYTPNAMIYIRKYVCNPTTLYLFNLYFKDIKTETFYKNKLEISHISTPSGVIPKEINKLGIWGDRHGGDFDFYKSIEDKVYRVQYQDEAIYIIRPQPHRFVLVRGDDVPG